MGLCMYDYKSLRLAVMICLTLINLQTYRHREKETDRQLLTSYIIR